MKAKLASASLALFATGFLLSQANAQTYMLTCTPAGSSATASASVIVELKTSGAVTTGSALMDLSLQNTDGSAPLIIQNIQVNGQIENGEDQNSTQAYGVLFAQPTTKTASISYARLAIGDNDAVTVPNSYIRDVKGTYYYSHCK